MLQEYPSCGEEHPKQRHLSLPHANCGGNRAARGSGGKKVSTSALRPYVKAGQLHCARHCEPRRQNGRAFFAAGERSEPRPRTAPKGLPQAEAWAERERVPSGHNCRRQLATGRPEQIQEPGTAVPGTPIFANNAQLSGPPSELPCRWLSLVLSFASKESTSPLGAAAPPPAP